MFAVHDIKIDVDEESESRMFVSSSLMRQVLSDKDPIVIFHGESQTTAFGCDILEPCFISLDLDKLHGFLLASCVAGSRFSALFSINLLVAPQYADAKIFYLLQKIQEGQVFDGVVVMEAQNNYPSLGRLWAYCQGWLLGHHSQLLKQPTPWLRALEITY